MTVFGLNKKNTLVLDLYIRQSGLRAARPLIMPEACVN